MPCPGRLIQVAYGYGLFTGGLGFHDAAEHMGLTVVPASSGNTLRQILLLQDFRPQGLACTPSFALYIGETMREQGIDPRSVGLRYGVFGAEPWTEAMRAQLEALWGITALDFYGLSEIIGPGVASECVEGRPGLHVNEDHFLPEIIDPHTGRAPAARARGRAGADEPDQGGAARCSATARATSRASTPRRARAGARPCASRASRGAATTCSSSRASTSIRPSSRRRCSAIDELAPHYQLVVDRSHEFPTLEVQVEPTEERGAAVGRLRLEPAGGDRACPRASRSACGAHLGLNPEVAIVPPKTIPRSEGKAVRVIERRATPGR